MTGFDCIYYVKMTTLGTARAFIVLRDRDKYLCGLGCEVFVFSLSEFQYNVRLCFDSRDANNKNRFELQF
jgi:hypothetical protein